VQSSQQTAVGVRVLVNVASDCFPRVAAGRDRRPTALARSVPRCQHPTVPDEPPVRLLRSGRLSPGVPYAYAATTPVPARLVFTAGACPLDGEGRTVAAGDVAGQTEQVMTNLRAALGTAGSGLVDVLMITVYVASSSRADLGVAWDVVRRHFGAHDVPGTLLGVTVLGWPDQLVEVEAVAVARDDPGG
jgi:enamine deaminase RidA (YjgF/YER057c/UK114 family)